MFKKSIAIIDDDPDLLNLFSEALTMSGYTVSSFTDPLLAYQHIQENPDKTVPFIFSYLGYKRGVDILTDSFQLKVCINLLRAGFKVVVPESTKEMDTPEEFKDYIYNDKVFFGTSEGYHIN